MVLDPASGAFAQINAVGVAIWERIDGHRTVAEIVDDLTLEFDAADDDIGADVVEFLHDLLAKGLLSIEH
jgi:coenzyme PQQ biosynthesis protein PqqD